MRFGRPLGALITVGLIILVGCLGKTTDSPAPIDILSPGKWTSLAPMPTARQEVAVAELNGRVFVIGGFGSGGEAVPTVEVYDPASDRWETRSPLPAATHHAAAAVVGGRLYVVGGYTGGRTSWTPLRTVYEYDEARSSWSTRAPLRVPRGGLAMVTLGNRLHAVGGSADRATGAHGTYDPASDPWPDAHAAPRHRRRGRRQPDLRAGRKHTARLRRHRRERGVYAVTLRWPALVVVVSILGAPAAKAPLAAGPTREEALTALADAGDVDRRRRG